MGTHCAFPSRCAHIAVQNPGPNAGPTLWARMRRSTGTFALQVIAVMLVSWVHVVCVLSCSPILLALACRMAASSSKNRRSKSVKDWLLSEIRRRRTLTGGGRRKLSRAQTAAGKTASVRLQAGRPPRASVTSASARRAKRRQRVAALRESPAIATELVRLRVVGKSSLPLASDVRRGLRFAV